MDFRQLEVFCAIVEWGNFSNAAKYLYITQPTISNHINKLEEELNTVLFERTTKTLTLSTSGKQLYEYATNLLRLRDKTLQIFNNVEDKKIQLGASSIPSAYIIPELLSAYSKTCPSQSFDIIQSDSSYILDQLKSGSLDVGFTGSSISDDHFYCFPIYQDEMVLVTPTTPEYLELKENNTPITEILQFPYIARENGSGTKMQSEFFLQSLGLDHTNLNIVAQMNDLEAIKQSIVHGLGISILSKIVVADLELQNSILSFPLDNNGIFRNYYIIYHRDRIINKNLLNFINFAKKYYML